MNKKYTLNTPKQTRNQHTMGGLWAYARIMHGPGEFIAYLGKEGYNKAEVNYILGYIDKMQNKDKSANAGRII